MEVQDFAFAEEHLQPSSVGGEHLTKQSVGQQLDKHIAEAKVFSF